VEKIKYRMLRHIWIWLKRFRHRKGYGVHSPFAFSFIRNVVYEKGAYYAYDEIDDRRHLFGSRGFYRRKLGRLLFRLANEAQPSTIVEAVQARATESHRYLSAGCTKARYISTHNATDNVFNSETDWEAERVVLHIASTMQARRLVEDALHLVRKPSMIIVDNIHTEKQFRDTWEHVVNDARTTVTFDLYDVGVAFFNNRLNKQHYIVNF
jgi:hypothetical protein